MGILDKIDTFFYRIKSIYDEPEKDRKAWEDAERAAKQARPAINNSEIACYSPEDHKTPSTTTNPRTGYHAIDGATAKERREISKLEQELE